MRTSTLGKPWPELYRAALDMAAWADREGLHEVLLSEHHGDADGFLPSPLVMAGAIGAVTRDCTVALKAMQMSLREPVALAEDGAVVDQITNGRLQITLVPGYVPKDFLFHGVPLEDRVPLFERSVERLAAALSGEPVQPRQPEIRVTPAPVQRPRPPVVLGGSAPAAAR